eukprot:3428942-Rhodomonas_salina.1
MATCFAPRGVPGRPGDLCSGRSAPIADGSISYLIKRQVESISLHVCRNTTTRAIYGKAPAFVGIGSAVRSPIRCCASAHRCAARVLIAALR